MGKAAKPPLPRAPTNERTPDRHTDERTTDRRMRAPRGVPADPGKGTVPVQGQRQADRRRCKIPVILHDPRKYRSRKTQTNAATDTNIYVRDTSIDE